MRFNKYQQKIINNISGAYLVSAPVGTGKTTVLAERVITAIEQGIKPSEILCLTFTNRAAEEMSERIKKRLQNKNLFDQIVIKTFHGFCAYFIKAEAKNIGINSDFVIFDQTEQTEVLKSVLEKHSDLLPIDEFRAKQEMYKIDESIYKHRLNNTMNKIGCKINNTELNKDLISVNNEYQQKLTEQNALDFNELVILTLKTLYLDKKIRKKWSKKYKLIQLDEFQDTHLSEYLVVKELAKEYKNIAFIGDLDQTIYGWRGSIPHFVVDLAKKHFKPINEVHLEINYRFNQGVLNASKLFLRSFLNPITKELKISEKEKNNKENALEIIDGYNINEEISKVISSIKKIKDKDQQAKIAVLARANYVISQTAEIFTKNKIAHITVDKYDFFKRKEIRDIRAYLNILFNKFDLRSCLRIISLPGRNIGQSTIDNILKSGEKSGLRLSDFLDFKSYSFAEPFANLINQWNKGRIIVLDTETTGTNTLKDEIIQIYALEIVNGEIGKDFHFYIKNNIPVGVSEEVHGLSNEFLQKNGKDPKEILNQLNNFINNDIVVGHNVNFDIAMIEENSKRLKISFNINEYYDTLDISRRMIESESYKLSLLADKLGLSSATHDAKDDVLATAGLLEFLVKKLKPLQEKRINLFKKYSKKFIKLSSQINDWQSFSKKQRPPEVLKYIWEDSGLKEHYKKDKQYKKRQESIDTLIKLFKDKDDKDKQSETSLKEMIRFMSLNKDIDFLGLEKGKIPIITIHQAKGLEFDYVFIIGVNEYKFPINRGDLEEEKRLFYVAITRARKKIFISYSKFDNYGRPMSKSRFIDYIEN